MKTLHIALILILLNSYSFAQTAQDFFGNTQSTLAYVGLDCSLVKLIALEKDAEELKKYFPLWNYLVRTEMDKFDIKKAFRRKGEIEYKTEVTDKTNNERSTDGLLITSSFNKEFTDAELANAVSQYDLEGVTSTYGLSFVAHSFDKPAEKGYVYAVIFDIKSKKVLFSKKLKGEPGGFGLRNYWARVIQEAIESAQGQYGKWSKEFK